MYAARPFRQPPDQASHFWDGAKPTPATGGRRTAARGKRRLRGAPPSLGLRRPRAGWVPLSKLGGVGRTTRAPVRRPLSQPFGAACAPPSGGCPSRRCPLRLRLGASCCPARGGAVRAALPPGLFGRAAFCALAAAAAAVPCRLARARPRRRGPPPRGRAAAAARRAPVLPLPFGRAPPGFALPGRSGRRASAAPVGRGRLRCAPRAAPLLFPRGLPGPQGRAASRARSARAVTHPAAPLFPSGLRPSWRRGPCSGGGRARGRRALGPGACLALARRARPPALGLAGGRLFSWRPLLCRPPMRSQAAPAVCPRPLLAASARQSCRAARGRQGRS